MKESLEGSTHGAIGSGSTLWASRLFTQAMVGTGNNLDLAISGEGFFVVNTTRRRCDLGYTRAGQFHIDDDGFIADGPTGCKGTADASGNLTRNVSDLRIALGYSAAADLRDGAEVNLDNQVPITAAFDVNSPDTTSDYTATVTIYDSVGKAYDAFYFTHQPGRPGRRHWNIHVMVGNNEVLTHRWVR